MDPPYTSWVPALGSLESSLRQPDLPGAHKRPPPTRRPAPRAGPAPAPPPGPSARTPRSCPRLRLIQPTLWPIRIILPTRYGLRRGPRVSHLQPRAGARRLTRSLAAGEGPAAPEGGGAARASAWRRRCALRAAFLRCAVCRRVSAGRGRGSRGSPGPAGVRAEGSEQRPAALPSSPGPLGDLARVPCLSGVGALGCKVT